MDDDEPCPNAWIYVMELCVVIVLSLVFEKGQDTLKEVFEGMGMRGETLLMIMNCVTKEIMILGFISLLVYVATKGGFALPVARMLFPLENVSNDNDPLAETFETIHMIIFCVMLMFIIKTFMLMWRAKKQGEKWERWERTRIHGNAKDKEKKDNGESEEKKDLTTMASVTMEQMMIEEGYLVHDGKGLTAQRIIKMEERPWIRIFQSGGILELLQWRAIRHVFMFPTHDEVEAEGIYNIPDKHHFLFHEYLSMRLGREFVELVEMDMSTWIISLCAATVLPTCLSFDPYYYPAISCLFSWLIFLAMFAFGCHIYTVYYKITPVLAENPMDALRGFEGTSAAALRRQHMTKQPATRKVSKHMSDEALSPDSPYRRKLSILKRPKLKLMPEHLEEPLLSIRDLNASRADGNGAEAQLKAQTTGPTQFELARQGTRKRVELHARFRVEDVDSRATKLRPLYMRLLARIGVVKRSQKSPNKQERLFLFQEEGPEKLSSILELFMFWQSVNTACYIVVWLTAEGSWDAIQYLWFCAGLCAPLYNTWTLIPKIISKLAIVSAVEHMKHKTSVEKVIFNRKREQLRESLKLLEIGRLQGKLERLSMNKLTRSEFDFFLQSYTQIFSQKKRNDIDKTFAMFDADNSGTIDEGELVAILASMGIEGSTSSGKAALKIMNLVDMESSGRIEKEEFYVLMAMALAKDDEKQAREDTKVLFKKFLGDSNLEELTIEQLQKSFASLGVNMDEEDMSQLVSSIFKSHKQHLSEEDFMAFMDGLERMGEE